MLVALLLALTPASAEARDFGSLYPPETLQQAHEVYAQNIRGVLFEDIAAYLLDDELATLRQIELRQPWDRTEDPFEVSADPAGGVLLLPTLSVKFLDDIAMATAWFERFDCDRQAVLDYVAALDFGPLALAPPLEALAVPPDAWQRDAYVNDVSQKTLNSAIAFLLLHELGHVHHRHRPYAAISAEAAQAQEAEADAFALGVLRRMRLPPSGVVLWFMAVSMRDPLVEGSPRQTHPLTASRLQAIAAALRTRPDDFIEPANRGVFTADTIRGLADQIEAIGRPLADPNLRSLLRERGRAATPELLAGACEADHQQEWLDLLRTIVE